jgi:hypothetical protein
MSNSKNNPNERHVIPIGLDGPEAAVVSKAARPDAVAATVRPVAAVEPKGLEQPPEDDPPASP